MALGFELELAMAYVQEDVILRLPGPFKAECRLIQLCFLRFDLWEGNPALI